MPLTPKHLLNFLEDVSNEKNIIDLLDILINRINKLCFEDCEIDRIRCTLTPMCSRRFLLKLRIKNDLSIEDLPKFCYSVHKNICLRDFRNKTIIYKPFDSYLYLVDFLDIFFHGDYRKLNKFISFGHWEDALKIFEERIHKSKEDFRYILSDNYMIFKYSERIHVIFLQEKYVLCSANRENIPSIELLKSFWDLYARIYFPEVNIRIDNSNRVEISINILKDVLSKIEMETSSEAEAEIYREREYFFNVFSSDIEAIMQYCNEFHFRIEKSDSLNEILVIRLHIGLLTNNLDENNEKIPLRFRDTRILINFIYRIYNDFFVIWIKKPDLSLKFEDD